jgi:release factor glutamine methyltransferase
MPQTATIAETLRRATEKLRAAAVPNDLLDAQTLLAAALGRDRTYLIVNFNQELSGATIEAYERLIARRAAGEPLQYITGHQEFFGLEFEVTRDVLIPRPETELIIEETIHLVQQRATGEGGWQPLIVDVGTGSGCIAVTLAREIGGARVVAVDLSLAALQVARRNAARHGLAERVGFVAGDLLSAFVEIPFADFIISNPPYVSAGDLATLQREVRDWEPRVALTDFADGLSFYRRLFRAAPARLQPGGFLICEIGYSQADQVSALIDNRIWGEIRLLEDLQGIPRTLVLRRKVESERRK